MTITSIMYLDMLQQFLIPQLDKDDQKGCIHFQQDGTPPHYLEKVRVPQHPFPRLVDWSSGADSMATLHPWIFYYGDLLKSECLNHLYLQMLLSSELGLLPQLRK
jgi:hypothetical protein